ncbi:MAG: ABC transporter permease, partial [Rhodoferax sp.]|nr:ABC transporter permease [Rhodoferax sp.]
MLELLRTFSWQELRHHPWRHGAAVVAVMLGVALAFAVHLINASALDEFAQAARSAGGEPDLSLSDPRGPFDESVFATVATHPDVVLASPVLDLHTQALGTVPDEAGSPARVPIRVLGLDALLVAAIAPALQPRL